MERRHFRKLCGAAEGKSWPAPGSVHLQEGTNTLYHTPNFRLGLKAKVNTDLFKKVINLTMDEIVSEPHFSKSSHSACYQREARASDTLPKALRHPDVHFTREHILVFVKKSFDSFKVKVLADDDPEHQEHYANNKKMSQRRQRQKHTFKKRLLAADKHTERSSLSVAEVQ
jgi:hypothetical protein